MSDQYTRVVAGGSLLPKSAPVVGLLFGTSESDGGKAEHLRVFDADDIPIDASDASTKQIELHQAVFPQHNVVGWYRVSRDDEPTRGDLDTTQLLQSSYCQSSYCQSAAERDGPSKNFVFCLLHVNSPDAKRDENHNSLSDELPISLYELHDEGGSPVLLAIDGWQLSTSESERIAVERVIREQPHRSTQATTDETNSKKGSKKKGAFGFGSKKKEQEPAVKVFSPYVSQSESVRQSLSAMKDRIDVLVDFLEQTQNGTIPPKHSLLRQVQGLLYALGPLASQASGGDRSIEEDAFILSHLAVITKTVSAVQSYTEKFRLVQESRPASGKDMMRRMV